VKTLAELLGAQICITDASNLKAGPAAFSPDPGTDSHLHKEPNPVIDGEVEEKRDLLLYNNHYYRLFPKNKFPNLTKYVVRLKSPFEKDVDSKDEESTVATEEGSYIESKKSTQETHPKHLPTSRPVNALKGGATKGRKQTIAAGTLKGQPDSKEASSAEDKKTPVGGTPFGVLGSALVGFLAGAGLVTTVYGLFKGGKFLYKKLFKGKAEREGRKLKRRMVDVMLEE